LLFASRHGRIARHTYPELTGSGMLGLSLASLVILLTAGSGRAVPLRRSRALWLVPAGMALHNLEEAFFFPRYLPLVLERLPESWRALAGPVMLGQVLTALVLVTVVPFILATWATLRPNSGIAVWLLLLIQATLLLNVIWHVIAAVLVFDGYAPGLITAVCVNLPVSFYLLRRAAREQWLSRGARWALLPGALLLHGPVLAALLMLTERLG
jgi:hypothetical protein